MERSSNRAYASLDGVAKPQDHRDAKTWYWRAPAFIASWLLFLGLLALQPLCNNQPQLRVTPGLLAGFAVAFITIGIALSGIAFFVCKQWRDRIDVICLYVAL